MDQECAWGLKYVGKQMSMEQRAKLGYVGDYEDYLAYIRTFRKDLKTGT